jgi:hypothetical protein
MKSRLLAEILDAYGGLCTVAAVRESRCDHC